MRIRKRSVPLPLSSLCPITLPDRDLYKLPSEQRQHGNKALRDAPPRGEEKEAKGLHPVADGDPSIKKVNTQLDQTQSSPNQPPTSAKLEDNRPFSDMQLLITRTRDGWICSDGGDPGEQTTNTPTQGDEDLEGEEDRRWRIKSNNFRKASSCVAEDADGVGLFTSADGLGLFSSSSNHVGRWCEGEKAFPLKKRRGSFKRKESEETIMDKEKIMKSRLRTQTSKKWVEEAEEEGKEGIDSNNSVKKRGNRGVVMEGSRCSRVNGRGWRCCQQTLVGYSLCEHHLGKGRLRSMSSVRKRTSAIAGPKKEETEERRLWSLSSSTTALSSPFQEMQTLLDEGEEEDEGKPLMLAKKRKKIGMVKARSISSLLGQTNNAIVTADSDSNSILRTI